MARNWLVASVAVILILGTTQCSHSNAGDNQAQNQSGQGTRGGQGSSQGGGSGRAGRGGAGGGAAVPVSAAPVQMQDMPVYLRGLGAVAAANTAIVKSRVDGLLVRINFQEGQEVKQGQLLAQIDPRTFQATVDQAKATLAKDEAARKDAQTNLARYEALFREQVIAQQQVDTQRSQVGQIEGQIGADKAQIEAAALQVRFTRITAPFSGQIGLRHGDVGNMIHAADPNCLATVTQLDPIIALFTLPEDQLQQVLSAMRK